MMKEAPYYTTQTRKRGGGMKIVGALMVILSCTGIGLYFSMMTKGRVVELKALKKEMYFLRGDITYGSTPLPEAIELLSRRNTTSHLACFFFHVALQLKKLEGRPFSEIWDEGINKNLEDSYLKEQDKEPLRRLGENLGFLDKDTQVKSIDLYIEILEQELEEAIRTEKEKTRLYNTLGVLSGVFLTVVLI